MNTATDYSSIGPVVFLNHERGFGFIRPLDGGVDVFFVAKDVRRDSHDGKFDCLRIGQLVHFTRGVNTDGRPRGYMICAVQEETA